jgi:hypothetical protein
MRLPCRSSCGGKPTAREVQADARGALLPATAAVIPETDYRQAALTFALRPIPPFRLDLTVWALRRRARNMIGRWDGSTYA